MTTLIERIAKHTVLVIFSFLTGLLVILGVLTTCYQDIKEHPFYVFPSCLPVVLSILLFLAILVLYHLKTKKVKEKKASRKNIRLLILLLFALTIGTAFVLKMQIKPSADQRICFKIAKDMHQGIYDEFKTEGYMQAYPQQAGLVLYFYLIGFITGFKSAIGIQLLNVLAYVCFIFCLYKISFKLWKCESIAFWTAVLSTLFIPLLFYTTFVYGTLMGLATSTFAIWKALEYMETKKLRPAILCILMGACSIWVKKNFIIAIIGITLLLLLHALCKKQLKSFFIASCLFVVALLVPKASQCTIEALSGYELGAGMPSISWVTMGLQTGSRANGWYNDYNFKNYMLNDCDTEAAAKQATIDLKARLLEFNNNKKMAVNFFTQKTASEWADPTFQCFFLIKFDYKKYDTDSSWISQKKTFYNNWLIPYLDVLQSLVFLGALLYVVYNRKRITLQELLLGIIFIGGFLFHTFWEAKGQYTICYFVLLFPYCIKGYAGVSAAVKEYITLLRSCEQPFKNVFSKKSIPYLNNVSKPVMIVVLIGILFAGARFINGSINQSVAACNTRYITFLTTQPTEKPHYRGQYYIKALDQDVFLDLKKTGKKETYHLCLTDAKRDAEPISIKEKKTGYEIHFKKHNILLSSLDIPTRKDEFGNRRKSFYHQTKKWAVNKGKDGSYTIKNPENFVLTRTDDGNLVFEPYDAANTAQKWSLSKIKRN